MDEALKKSGDWPNIAITPGTRRHAATGEHVEQPESTRIGRPRGACRPDKADCESEPARVNNGAQDGLECDTREQLEADVREWIDIATYKAFTPERMLEVMLHWLNRQAAITHREVEHDLMLAGHMAVEVERKRIAELTAERDRLKYVAQKQADSFAKFERENARLRDKLERVREMVGGDAE